MTFIILILMCVWSYLSVKPFQFLWIYLNFLQILVHIGIIAYPLPSNMFEMLKQLFPWVSLTQIESHSYLEQWIDGFSVAPPFNSAFYQLGYRTRNAADNAGSLNTLLALPAVFTVLYGFLYIFRNVKLFKVLRSITMQWETVQAVWIRVFLVCFLPATLISL